MAKLCNAAVVRRYNRNTIVYKEGAVVRDVKYLMTGECRILKRTHIALPPSPSSPLSSPLAPPSVSSPLDTVRRREQEQREQREQREKGQKGQVGQVGGRTVLVEVATKSCGSVFGDQALISHVAKDVMKLLKPTDPSPYV